VCMVVYDSLCLALKRHGHTSALIKILEHGLQVNLVYI